MDGINDTEPVYLPDEVWLKILESLDAKSISSCSSTSWALYQLTNEPELWKRLYRRNWPSTSFTSERVPKDCWKYLYIDRIVKKQSKKDFQFIKLIGKGATGKVWLVKKKEKQMIEASSDQSNTSESTFGVNVRYFTGWNTFNRRDTPDIKDDSSDNAVNLWSTSTPSKTSKKEQLFYAMKIIDTSILSVNPSISNSLFRKNAKNASNKETESDKDDSLSNRLPTLHSHFFEEDEDGNEQLHLLMDFMPGADLLTLLLKYDYLTEEQTRFYAMELVLCLEDIHKESGPIKYLKPSNILRDELGRLKVSLSDYGNVTGYSVTRSPRIHSDRIAQLRDNNLSYEIFEDKYPDDDSTIVEEGVSLLYSIPYNVGLDKYVTRTERAITWKNFRRKMNAEVFPQSYVAPEVILAETADIYDASSITGYKSDIWTLGVILFELLIGYPPFCAHSTETVIHKILNWNESLHFPKHEMSPDAHDLIRNLLCNYNDRLDLEQIKSHRFFRSVDWKNPTSKLVPLVPIVSGPADFSNFDDFDEIAAADDLGRNVRTSERFFLSYYNA